MNTNIETQYRGQRNRCEWNSTWNGSHLLVSEWKGKIKLSIRIYDSYTFIVLSTAEVQELIQALSTRITKETNMEDFSIFNGVPIPGNKRNGQSPYPWTQLEIGQSFFIPPNRCMPTSCSSLVSMANKRFAPKRFLWRKHTLEVHAQSAIDGAMIWRVK